MSAIRTAKKKKLYKSDLMILADYIYLMIERDWVERSHSVELLYMFLYVHVRVGR